MAPFREMRAEREPGGNSAVPAIVSDPFDAVRSDVADVRRDAVSGTASTELEVGKLLAMRLLSVRETLLRDRRVRDAKNDGSR